MTRIAHELVVYRTDSEAPARTHQPAKAVSRQPLTSGINLPNTNVTGMRLNSRIKTVTLTSRPAERPMLPSPKDDQGMMEPM